MTGAELLQSGYVFVLAGLGAIILLTAWLPMVLKELPLSLPIVCVVIGAIAFSTPALDGFALHPLKYPLLTERFTEFVVIIALMGAGLKLDRLLDAHSWRSTGRLLLIAMPLTILTLAILGYAILGLGIAGALLLGAALAPTDPVLASDVQVGPPGQGGEDEVRFTLTSEAGLNDGLAFPFINLAIALAAYSAGAAGEAWFANWLTIDVFWKLAAGAGIGWLTGKLLGWLIFHLPNRSKLSRTGDGFVALGVTCLAYGLTEIAHGYGFIAVFVAALGIRAAESDHDYHEKMHEFVEQLERLLMMILLVLFGGALVEGGLLGALTWSAVFYALLAIFIVRPVAAWISLGATDRVEEKAVISFFGIRGVGSAYYIAYALNHGKFDQPDLLWSVVSLIVLISITIHGATVTPVMRYVDAISAKKEADDPGMEAEPNALGKRG